MRTSFALTAIFVAFSFSPLMSQKAESRFPVIAGWERTVTPDQYTPENLWDFIDGAAEVYLSYGFHDLSLAEYTNSSEISVRVEVYAHRSRPDAFGIYAQERNPSYQFVDVGAQGYVEEGVLNFLCGIFYVKLTTHQTGSQAQDALIRIARLVDSHLAQPREWPPALALFPAQDKISNTEMYVSEHFLGYPALGSAYLVDYEATPSYKMFLLVGESNEELQNRLSAFARSALRPEMQSISENTVHLLEDRNNGPLYLLRSGRFLCGTIGCSNAASAHRALMGFQKSLTNAR